MCRGQGVIITDPCTDCRGNGLGAKSETLTVTVPPGVDHGQTLRLAGKGEAPLTGKSGQYGHLYIVLDVEEDDRFERDGQDIHSEAAISYSTAALGGVVNVDTLDDNLEGKTEVEIKAGTQPGDIVAQKGQGIPQIGRGGRGNHYVHVRVVVPKNLSDREKELLRELADLRGEERNEPRGFFGRRKHKKH